MAVPTEFYVYVGYGIFAMVSVTMVLNFLLGGFLGPFMKVKRSRGSKILVRVHHPVQDYFRAGAIEESFLVFKDREKKVRRIPMKAGVVSRAATVFWVEVDDEKNCLFERKGADAIQTYDAVKVDNLLTRAITAPGLVDNLVKIVLVLCIVILIAALAGIYMTYKNGQLIIAMQTAASATTGVIA